jgi:hypothetical protein
MVKRYYYEYTNNLMSIKVDRTYFRVTFLTDNTSRIFYNRVNFIGTVVVGSDSVIELMPDSSYLTADGTKFEFDPINNIITITHTQDDTNIICYGDSSIEVNNNGFLPDYEDDKHRILRPKIVTSSMPRYQFDSKFTTSVRIARILAPNSVKRVDFSVYSLAPVQGLPMGQVVGENKSYSILTDDSSQVISCLIYDYTRNSLDAMFA